MMCVNNLHVDCKTNLLQFIKQYHLVKTKLCVFCTILKSTCKDFESEVTKYKQCKYNVTWSPNIFSNTFWYKPVTLLVKICRIVLFFFFFS